MYYIFKLSGRWSVMDATTGKSIKLDNANVEWLRTHFPQVLKESSSVLTALLVDSLPANKLLKLKIPEAGSISYYVFKLSEDWSIAESLSGKDKPLNKEDVENIRNLFPTIFPDSSILFYAIQITDLPANKLLKIELADQTLKTKKISDLTKNAGP